MVIVSCCGIIASQGGQLFEGNKKLEIIKKLEPLVQELQEYSAFRPWHRTVSAIFGHMILTLETQDSDNKQDFLGTIQNYEKKCGNVGAYLSPFTQQQLYRFYADQLAFDLKKLEISVPSFIQRAVESTSILEEISWPHLVERSGFFASYYKRHDIALLARAFYSKVLNMMVSTNVAYQDLDKEVRDAIGVASSSLEGYMISPLTINIENLKTYLQQVLNGIDVSIKKQQKIVRRQELEERLRELKEEQRTYAEQKKVREEAQAKAELLQKQAKMQQATR